MCVRAWCCRGASAACSADHASLRGRDQTRPVSLQQLLEGEGKGGRGSQGLQGAGTKMVSRGNKRHKSWLAGGGKGTGARGRDLGSLNAELAEELAGVGALDTVDVEVEVDSVHVMEAVRDPGTRQVRYETLMRIPLGRGAAVPLPMKPPTAAPAPEDGTGRGKQDAPPAAAASASSNYENSRPWSSMTADQQVLMIEHQPWSCCSCLLISCNGCAL
jgi:hypothetical protein